MIGYPELLVLAVLVLLLVGALLTRDDPDHGTESTVGANTLAHYARQDMHRGWDREAHHCGPWQGRNITEAERGLKWVNR